MEISDCSIHVFSRNTSLQDLKSMKEKDFPQTPEKKRDTFDESVDNSFETDTPDVSVQQTLPQAPQFKLIYLYKPKYLLQTLKYGHSFINPFFVTYSEITRSQRVIVLFLRILGS